MKIYLRIALILLISGCDNEPKFAVAAATMDCDQGSCIVHFEVTNTSGGKFPLFYEVSLLRQEDTTMVVVGETDGTVDLPSRKTQTIEIEIHVTETPTSLKIFAVDSRMPKVIHEIVDP